MKARKLAAFGFAFALAELAAAYLPSPAVLPTAAFLLAIFGVLCCVWASQKQRPVLCIPVCGLALGMLFFCGYHIILAAPVGTLADTETSCTVVVETDCEDSYIEGMCGGTLRVISCSGEKADFLVACSVFPYSEAGDSFSANLAFRELDRDDYRMSHLADGVFLAADYAGGYQAQGQKGGLHFSLYRLRKALAGKLHLYLSRDAAALESAMLLGNRSSLSKTVKMAFQGAGVSHLLAVSGLHVTMLCGIFLLGDDRKKRFDRRWIAARILLILFYMALTGFPVSVVRAGSAFILMEIGYFLREPPDALTSLGAIAVLLGLQNAYAPCDLGFQLSYCAVIGVLGANSLLQKERAYWGAKNGKFAENSDVFWLEQKGWQLLGNVQVAACASLATIPVLLWHSLMVSGVGILSNLLVVWMVKPALLLGVLVLLFALLPFLAPFTAAVGFLLSLLLKIMQDVVGWCAALPLARLALPQQYTLFAFAILLLSGYGMAKHSKRRQTIFLWAAEVAAAVLLGCMFRRDVVSIAFLGNSANPCAVVTENGEAAVLFRGGAANQNAVVSYLQKQGNPREILLIDLRRNANDMEFAAATTIQMETLAAFETKEHVLNDVEIQLYHTEQYNLAVLEIKGYHIGMAAGTVESVRPISLDLLLAGQSCPEVFKPATILTLQRQPKWQSRIDGCTLLKGNTCAQVILRPGRSISFEGVSRSAL
jgi:competence protein ComEC